LKEKVYSINKGSNNYSIDSNLWTTNIG